MRYKKIFTALLLIVTLTSIVMAQQSDKSEDPTWIKEVVTHRILYAVPGMEKS